MLARWSDGVAHRVAVLDVEKSKGLRDVEIGAGVRHFNDNGSVAAVASVSVPLQLFDRNLGGIAAAERRLAKGSTKRRPPAISCWGHSSMRSER